MRLGLDGHTLGTGAGGNETYVRGLLEGLAALDGGPQVVVYVSTAGPGPGELGPGARRVLLRSSGPLRRLAWEFPRRLFHDRVDVAHFQYVGPLVAPCPVVVSIHDPSFRLAPELLGWPMALRLRWSTALALRSAAAVLVPSRWTQRTLATFYPGAADRIRVVPLGRSEQFRGRASPADVGLRESVGLPGRYLLYVGRRQRRKNVEGLLEAYGRAVTLEPDLPPLALVGPSGPEDPRIRRQAARAGGRDLAGRVLLLSDVADEALPAVYRGAELFCYPARYEGFGLPVLEAMSCGVPVVAVDEGALPELVGEAGLLLPPEAPDEWAATLVELNRDTERCRELGSRGRQRVAGYTWRQTAELTRLQYAAAIAAR